MSPCGGRPVRGRAVCLCAVGCPASAGCRRRTGRPRSRRRVRRVDVRPVADERGQSEPAADNPVSQNSHASRLKRSRSTLYTSPRAMISYPTPARLSKLHATRARDVHFRAPSPTCVGCVDCWWTSSSVHTARSKRLPHCGRGHAHAMHGRGVVALAWRLDTRSSHTQTVHPDPHPNAALAIHARGHGCALALTPPAWRGASSAPP